MGSGIAQVSALAGYGVTVQDISKDALDRSKKTIEGILAEMKGKIEQTGWLAGPDYSLADMAWATSWRTWQLAGYPLEKYPVAGEWIARVEARPAWQEIARLWADPPTERLLEFPARAA